MSTTNTDSRRYDEVSVDQTSYSTSLFEEEYITSPEAQEHHDTHSYRDPSGYQPSHPAFDIQTVGARAETQEGTPRTVTSWQPFFLHKLVLWSFSVVFVLCLLGTALLYEISRRNNGLSTQHDINHYAWKYGPSAVLTIILYLWYSIDLSVRSLLPWQELRRGPKPAAKTVLLDYISPLITTSLWRALKNCHWPVVLTITGRLLILLAIAFSTGLLVLSPTEVELGDISLVAAKLDAKSFKAEDVGPVAADMYYGVQFGNLVAPVGTFRDTFVSPFTPRNGYEASGIPAGAALRATVPGVHFSMDCEVLDIKNSATVSPSRGPQNDASVPGDYLVINVTTPSCNIKGAIVGIGPNSRKFVGMNPNKDEHDYQARVADYVCNLEWNYNDIYDASLGAGPLLNLSTAPWSNASFDHRVLLSVTDVHVRLSESSLGMGKVTAVLCKPSYATGAYLAEYDGVSRTVETEALMPDGQTSHDLPGFSQSELGPAVLSAISQVDSVDLRGEQTRWTGFPPPLFGLMKLQHNVSTIRDFQDAGLLKESFSEVFNGVAAQLARHMLMVPGDESNDIRGSARFTQHRLHVTDLSTGIMCAALSLLIIISASLVFFVPRDVVVSEPGSVLATASSVQLGIETERLLKGLGQARDVKIRQSLESYLFVSRVGEKGGEISIEASNPQHGTPSKPSKVISGELQWWTPLGSQNWFLLLSIVVPLLLMGLLELFQRQSAEHNGFVDVRSRFGEVAANYVPAIISMSVGAMYSSIVAAAAVFAPYATLSKGTTQASRSIAVSYVTQTGPRLVYRSLRNRHFGVSTITLAQLVASTLTIVLSGLYSTVEVPFQADIALQQLDTFNISDTISTGQPNAGLLTKLITYHNLSFPSWTYDSIVFPQVSVVDAPAFRDEIADATIKSHLPGIRGNLNCTSMPSRLFHTSITDQSSIESNGRQDLPLWNYYVPKNGMDLVLEVNRPLPASLLCDDHEENNNKTLIWTSHFFLKNDSTPSAFGKISRIQWNSQFSGGSNDIGRRLTKADRSTHELRGCPTVGITLGHVTAKLPHNVTNKYNTTYIEWTPTDVDIGTLLCWPEFEEVEADVTFNWPGLELSSTSPPVINESSMKKVTNPTTNSSTWDWDFAGDEYSVWDSLKNTNDLLTQYGYLQDETNFDPFILALINGGYSVPLEQISGENNTEALFHEVQALWGRYMAQSISQNMRLDIGTVSQTTSSSLTTRSGSLQLPRVVESGPSTKTYPANVEAAATKTRRRLKQNGSSKIALQAMLGSMVVGVICMRALVSFRKILPHNPTSIAGSAALVVDGNLRDMAAIVPREQLRDNKGPAHYIRVQSSGEVNGDAHGSGHLYTMGWWNDGGFRKFGVMFAEGRDRT
ncbi:hypothetical protein JX265_009787 [Neoarthrinium moseri]|uniref:Uncharacterized protein n=1 Tax=Neoarthrinium moseri TaxID=1658444 RepID=A0A9P9WFW9_9PEZI|nr:hypothetical protein JX265_009787 [Neoarthrinium moseri]